MNSTMRLAHANGRTRPGRLRLGVAIAAFGLAPDLPAGASLMISGNENKIDLTSGTASVLTGAPADTLTFLDFSSFPPQIQHLTNVANSVIGPPSNIAITPGGTLALIANSLRTDPGAASGWSPASSVHVLDLEAQPPRVIAEVPVGLQPSGISITPDGRLALVANRAEGTVSVLRISGRAVEPVQNVTVCPPAESASDVAISPDGKRALVSIQKGGYLAVLAIEGHRVRALGRRYSVYGQPYRCVISPDGALGLTAGQGWGNGLDLDALTVVDLQAQPPRTSDFIPIGSGPESLELSPDGNLLAAVVMNGSNLPPDDPNYHPSGQLVLLARTGRTFQVVQQIPVGRIPEGVAFSPDGRYLVVQCHPDRELWVFAVRGQAVADTGLRLAVPGMPSSLRAAPR